MQIYKTLNQITEIITGYTFREAIHGEPNSALLVLQAKNLKDDMFIDDLVLTKTNIVTSHTKAFAQTGDVAIGSRGVFRAGVIKSDKQILAASSVYLLRINDKSSVLPEYLATYLNSISGQRNLSQFLTSGTIRTLLRKDLENIRIPVPPFEKQKQIIGLDQNIREQTALLNRKITAQKNIVGGILNQLERSPS